MKLIFVFLLAFVISVDSAQSSMCERLFAPELSKLAQVRKNILDKYEVDKKLSDQKEWVLSPGREEQLKNILLKMDLNSKDTFNDVKLEEFYWALIDARLESISPASRKFAEFGAKDALNQESWYGRTLGRALAGFAGPHYNPLFNRIGLPYKRSSSDFSIIDYILGAHETEHLVHRNTSPKFFLPFMAISAVEMTMVLKTPFTPLFIRRMETRAISAQWELANRIPENIRNQLIEQLRDNKISSYKDQEIKTILSSNSFDRATELFSQLKSTWEGSHAKKRLIEFMYDPKLKDSKIALIQTAAARLRKVDAEFLKSFIEDPTFFITFSELQKEHTVDIELLSIARSAVLKGKYGKHSEIYKTIVINTLKNASLTREEFVNQLGPRHGYNLDNIYKAFYKRGMINYIVYLNAIVYAVASYMDPAQASNIIALDVRALVELLQYTFLGL